MVRLECRADCVGRRRCQARRMLKLAIVARVLVPARTWTGRSRRALTGAAGVGKSSLIRPTGPGTWHALTAPMPRVFAALALLSILAACTSKDGGSAVDVDASTHAPTACASVADCPEQSACLYPVAESCGATGQCVHVT